jgi:hypothetical protein
MSLRKFESHISESGRQEQRLKERVHVARGALVDDAHVPSDLPAVPFDVFGRLTRHDTLNNDVDRSTQTQIISNLSITSEFFSCLVD